MSIIYNAFQKIKEYLVKNLLLSINDPVLLTGG